MSDVGRLYNALHFLNLPRVLLTWPRIRTQAQEEQEPRQVAERSGASGSETFSQMRRELQQTRQKLASTEQKLASTKEELQGEIDLLRGKNLESMDKKALVKRKTDLEDMQRRVDDAILRREVEEEMQEEPSSFICPITMSLMINPVIASDGHSYEQNAIQEHIRRQGADAKSPQLAADRPQVDTQPQSETTPRQRNREENEREETPREGM